MLLGRNARRAPAAGGTAAAIEAVREALADHDAPAEVRLRPVAHTLLTTLVGTGRTPADLTRLAATIGLTRPPRD